MLALRKLINKPKLTDGRPLAVFYYCDEAVNHQMQELNHLMKTTPDNLDRRATLIRQLKESQHNLMSVIFAITRDAIPEHHTSRDFRAKYPDDVLVDQINGPLWFGAECIAAGSHILNHELESEQLRPFAIQLSKTISRVRVALKEQCLTSRDTYSQQLKDMLQEFDVMWADFEFRYVGLMCNVKSERQYYHQQDVVVLFCESTLRGLKREYINHDMIEMMDPSIMFAIPRLAIIFGLVVCSEGPLDPSKPTKEIPSFFRGYQTLLGRIKELLGYLTEEQLTTLEKALCSSEGLGSLNLTPSKIQQLQKTVPSRPLSTPSNSSLLASSATTTANESSSPSSSSSSSSSSATSSPSLSSPSQSNPTTPSPQRRDTTRRTSVSHQRSRSLGSHDLAAQTLATREQVGLELPPQSLRSSSSVAAISSTPGDMHGVRSGAELPSDSASFQREGTTEAAAAAAITREGEHFPQFEPDQPVANDLPTATPIISTPHLPQDKHSSPSSSPTAKCKHSRKPSHRGSHRSKGPAGFASAEDLMHRLFVAISGVADQLQTNHARDLRVILRDVFTVCQSEPEPPLLPPATPGGEKSEEEMESRQEFMMESSPTLVPSAEGFGYNTFSLQQVLSSPSWVPDRECLNCTACHETFSWKRRRHHCRSCGQVVCGRCSPHSLPLPHSSGEHGRSGRGGGGEGGKLVRVCTSCYLQQLGVAARISATSHTPSPAHPVQVL